MKIAMVAEHASPLATLDAAGAGRRNIQVAALSAALAKSGHDVTLYTRRDAPGQPRSVVTDDGYRVTHVPAGPAEYLAGEELLPHMGEFAQCLDAEWTDHRPDVAHAQSWMSGIATQLAAKANGVPTVQTFHGLGAVERRHQRDEDTSPPERLRLESAVAKGADWVAAASTEEMFELIRMGRSRSRISVVPSGVDSDTFTPLGRRADRGERPRILAVGHLLPRKGFDTVIRALPMIRGAEFVIAGGPPVTQLGADPGARRLRALAAELGVGDRVHFLGACSHADMPSLYRSADVVACTPWYEPSGTVPLEAMACGIPVIASSVGGLTDTVVDEVTGRLVPPGEPGRFAEAAKSILRESFMAGGMGSSGRDRARSRYPWDRIAADILRIYDRLTPSLVPTTRAAQ